MIGTLASESFANLSMRATATANGETTRGSVTSQTASIRYDASKRSYTLSTGGGTITFGPGDLDSVNSNAVATVYTKRSGSTTDVFTLTKAGTSGLATYQYVGSAFWEHTQISGSSGSGSVDALVYGIPTASIAVPRTGTGAYEVALIGVESVPGGSAAMAGSGGGIVEFDTGKIRISGTMNGIYFSEAQFDVTGTLSASGNSIGGSIKWSDAGNFTGALNGEFFGPAAQELGAVFNAAAPDGRVAVGTITGRKGALGNAKFTEGKLINTQIFSASARRLDFRSPQRSVNSDTLGDFTDQALKREPLQLAFDAVTKKYTVTTPEASYSPIALASDSDFQDDDTALMLNNTRTYAATGIFRRRSGGTSIDRQLSYSLDYFIYGMPTSASALPRTGSGDYKVRIDGLAIDNGYTDALSVGGDGILAADFATGRLNLSTVIGFAERDIISGHFPQRTSGILNATGTISSTDNTFSGNLTFNGIGNYTGTFDGNFFGPEAQELAATWSASDGTDKAIGTIIGTKDASLAAAKTPLADLTATTSFQAITLRERGLVDASTITYNPATGGYNVAFAATVAASAFSTRFDQTVIDPARSDASRTWYDRPFSVSGYVFKTGVNNPVIQLTYATFADLRVRDPAIAGTDPTFTQYMTVYGNRTPYALLPRFGTATYQGIVRARGVATSISYNGTFSGTATATADFGKLSVDTTINIVADDAAATSIGTFGFTANVFGTEKASSIFRGFATLASGASRGEIEGSFFGPNADEIGAAWFLQRDGRPDGFDIAGILVGKKN